jgi:hypothetical protein
LLEKRFALRLLHDVLYVEFWSRRIDNTIDNNVINLIKLHYLLFELHSTRPKFDA